MSGEPSSHEHVHRLQTATIVVHCSIAACVASGKGQSLSTRSWQSTLGTIFSLRSLAGALTAVGTVRACDESRGRRASAALTTRDALFERDAGVAVAVDSYKRFMGFCLICQYNRPSKLLLTPLSIKQRRRLDIGGWVEELLAHMMHTRRRSCYTSNRASGCFCGALRRAACERRMERRERRLNTSHILRAAKNASAIAGRTPRDVCCVQGVGLQLFRCW